MKIFHDKNILKAFMAIKSDLQNILERILKPEGKNKHSQEVTGKK